MSMMNHTIPFRIGIIGTGNVAWHLSHLLQKAGATISGLLVRNAIAAEARGIKKAFSAPLTDDPEVLKQNSDLILVAVNDSHIPEIAARLAGFSGYAVHTSGSVSMEVLSRAGLRAGVFYPLQTLTRGRMIDPAEIPVCIEASEDLLKDYLFHLAHLAGCPAVGADSVQRLHLHIAAVMVNNFTNHLFVEAWGLLHRQNLSHEMLLPLIRETVKKAAEMDPMAAQTGPAARHDLTTIGSHLAQLENDPPLRHLYQVLTEAIMNKQQR